MLYSWHIIGERIRKNRKEQKLSQEQLAQIIEQITTKPIKRQTIAGWENGKPINKIEQLTALCEIFNCDMAYLLCECDTKHIKTQDICITLGISEKAVNTIITAKKNGSVLTETISDLLENEELLYRIHDCCTAVYINVNHDIQIGSLFSDGNRHIILSPEKLQQVDLMILYNTICDFVNYERNKNIK